MGKINDLFHTEYKHEATYATGLVQPKTTALFFDKIWLPEEEARSFSVPNEIRFTHSSELENQFFRNYCVPNKAPLFSSDFHGIEKSSNEGPDINSISTAERQARRILSLIMNSQDPNEYITSYNRNEGIREVVNYFNSHGISITPIFIDRTDFENSLLLEGPKKFSNLSDKYFADVIQSLTKDITSRNVNAIEATIKSIPTIIEDKLSWDQVLEARKDRKSVENLRRFRLWANDDLAGKSQSEIVEIISQKIEDYEHSLRKHGILTTIGGFTTVLSSASTIVGAITENQTGLIAAGLSVSAGIITYSAQQLYEYFDTTRQPIAYIYNLTKKAV